MTRRATWTVRSRAELPVTFGTDRAQLGWRQATFGFWAEDPKRGLREMPQGSATSASGTKAWNQYRSDHVTCCQMCWTGAKARADGDQQLPSCATHQLHVPILLHPSPSLHPIHAHRELLITFPRPLHRSSIRSLLLLTVSDYGWCPALALVDSSCRLLMSLI